MDYYVTVKKNGVLIHATTQMHLENIMVSKETGHRVRPWWRTGKSRNRK